MILLWVAGILSIIAFFLDTSVPLNWILGVVLFAVVFFTCLMSFYEGLL